MADFLFIFFFLIAAIDYADALPCRLPTFIIIDAAADC